MYYHKLMSLLISNKKELLKFNIGSIKATITGDGIEFTSIDVFAIYIQIITYCDQFKKVQYRDEDDFENTTGIGRNTARQVIQSWLIDEKNKAYITSEFLSDFIGEWNLSSDSDLEESQRVFEHLLNIKKYKNFKF